MLWTGLMMVALLAVQDPATARGQDAPVAPAAGQSVSPEGGSNSRARPNANETNGCEARLTGSRFGGGRRCSSRNRAQERAAEAPRTAPSTGTAQSGGTARINP